MRLKGLYRPILHVIQWCIISICPKEDSRPIPLSGIVMLVRIISRYFIWHVKSIPIHTYHYEREMMMMMMMMMIIMIQILLFLLLDY